MCYEVKRRVIRADKNENLYFKSCILEEEGNIFFNRSKGLYESSFYMRIHKFLSIIQM